MSEEKVTGRVSSLRVETTKDLRYRLATISINGYFYICDTPDLIYFISQFVKPGMKVSLYLSNNLITEIDIKV